LQIYLLQLSLRNFSLNLGGSKDIQELPKSSPFSLSSQFPHLLGQLVISTVIILSVLLKQKLLPKQSLQYSSLQSPHHSGPQSSHSFLLHFSQEI
jgi:hypothetical protein